MIDKRFPMLTLAAQVLAAGTLVMVLELSGSRVLTPVYGSSINTWGGLIGVVLACLTLGYYVGGRLADKLNGKTLLTNLLMFSALYTLAIPTISPIVLGALDPSELDLRAGIVASSLIILGPPTVMLGAVSPAAVKVATKELAKLGRIAGNLYALSTLGSIAGTFFTTFVLVPAMDIQSIFYISGSSLLAVAIMGMSVKRIITTILVSLLIFFPANISFYLVCVSSFIGDVKFRGESLYNQIIVLDRGGERLLYLNGLLHSGMDKSDPYALIFDYTKLFTLGPLLKQDAERVLFVGGGGFSGPKFFLKNYDDLLVDVVEIDPNVVEVAKRFFEVKPDRRLSIYIDDGRRYLASTETRYDVIILDAYSKNYIPFHMLTLEFFTEVKSSLTRDGVVVSNIISSIAGPTSDILRASYKTMKAVFRQLLVIPVTTTFPFQVQNVVIVASDSDTVSPEELVKRAKLDPITSRIGVDELVMNVLKEPLPTKDVPILTDAYAPVENILNPVTGAKFGQEYYLGVQSPSLCG